MILEINKRPSLTGAAPARFSRVRPSIRVTDYMAHEDCVTQGRI
jgi:hypothetical protein